MTTDTTTKQITKFRAYAKDAPSTYGESPHEAALLFFSRNPKKRKCSVIEGYIDGPAFVTAYTPGNWPYSAHDVTKANLYTLPH
jgi:hypothetical protein